jgi:predicted transcriptional regulator
MANEEMRRLKMAIEATRDQAQAAVGAGEGGSASAAGTAVAEQYIWSISVNTELVGEGVPTGTKVNFIAGDGVQLTRNGTNITISATGQMQWTANADSGSVNVPSGSSVRFTGANGVTTTADTSTRSIIIDRPLQIKQRGIEIGQPDTVTLDFWNRESHRSSAHTSPVFFHVHDLEDGTRRVHAWVTPGDYTWDFLTQTNVPETINSGEQVTFTGGANVTVTNVGNVITIAANAAAGTLQLQQEGVNIGPNDTAVINWDNATALKPAGYTSRVWTEVINDGGGVRRLIAWYEPGSGGSYYWNLQASGGAIEQIDTAETVNFAAAGNLAVARTGNTITYSYTQPALYYWNIQANGGAIEQIDTTETVNFAAAGNLTVARAGNTITYSYTQPASYYWNLQANGGAIEQIDTTESVNFAASGNLTVARAGNTITYSYTQPAAYYWNLQASGGAIEQIDTTESVNFAASGNLTVARSGNTITYSYTQPAAYTWTASNGPVDITVSASNEVTWTGDSGVTVSLNSLTRTFTIDRPLQIEDDGVAVGDDATLAINFDSNGGTGTSYAEFEVADVGGGERRVRVKYNAGAGQYWWNLQAGGGAIEQIDSNESVNFAAGGNITVARVGNTITYTYNEPAGYNWIASDNTNTATVTTTETVKWVGASGATVTLNSATQTFTVDRPLQIKDDAVAVGNNATTAINFDSNGATGTTYAEFEVADVGGGERRVRVKYNQNATQYYWNLQAAGGAIEQIDSTENVNFAAGGDLTVARVGNTITYSYTQPAAYSWYAGDASTSTQVTNGEFVRWQGDSGVTVSLNTATQMFTIDRPLQLQQEGTNIGNDSTVTINWDNATVAKPVGHTGRVWTEIIDDGAGVRRLIAWYEPGAGAYYWNLQANGGAIEQIDSAENVNFTASGNLTVTRTGNTINYAYSQPAPYTWTASDGTNTAVISTGETVVITADATATVTFNASTQTYTVSRPLTLRQSGTAVGNNATREINFANATLTKPAGYTAQGWVEVTDNPTSGVNRDIKVFFEPPTSTYGWNIEADNPIGTSAAVANGATVKISGTNGIVTRRVNDDIIISISDDYGPGDGSEPKQISGFIEFPNNVADYIGAVPYRYGTRQYVDILHNFDLGNQNAFELHLIDVNHDSTGSLVAYRSGATTMSGENPGNVKFRNMPHWAALDNNTIRVWATMSRGKPTSMKFWYTLRSF